ncbi:DUF192 domain-containing protein [Streptomyces sp. NPDC001985]|uniref:DUF192 domain-containing protein n=1 Tax=Streptomyces sp. NPDC001985 TaxID=3154406 RepID=UPI0033187457
MRRSREWRDGEAELWIGGRGGPVVLEIAASHRTRRRGLLGRDTVEGAILLAPCSGIHTLGMRFTIDVAYLDQRLRVLDLHTLPPGRLGRPRLRARYALEARGGAMAAWGITRGALLRIEQP